MDGYEIVPGWVEWKDELMTVDLLAGGEDVLGHILEFLALGEIRLFALFTRKVARSSRKEARDALRDACSNGHTETAQWLVKKTRDAFDAFDAFEAFDALEAFCCACGNGHTGTAQWLTKEFNIELAESFPKSSAATSHRQRTNWSLEYNNYKLTAKNIVNALCCACENGHTGTVQWLTKEFNLTAKNFAHGFDRCQHYSHESLVNEFNLTVENIFVLYDKLHIFRWACRSGFTKTVQWLVKEFNLTVESDCHDGMLARAKACGLIETEQWLTKEFTPK